MHQAVNRYYETQINTASPEDLTMMLYNGCIRFLKQARVCIEDKNYESKNIYITKAINIIDELQVTLDMKFELSNNLYSLYDYFKERLILANMQLSIDVLQEIIDMVVDLRDTWHEAIKMVKHK